MTRKDQTPSDLSPVFARGVAARPQVQAPDSPWTVWAGLAGAAVLGVMVFNGLSSGREARAQTTQQTPMARAVTPPPAAVAAPAPPVAQQVAAPAPYAQQSVAPPADPEQAHWRAPTVVVDFGNPGAAADGGQQLAQATTTVVAPGATVVSGGDGRQSADERFSAGVTRGLGDTARAGQMRDLSRTIPQGSVIPATLETAINSDLPGAVRAVVSRDVRGFDGSRVLIPRGSRLVGQYKSAAAIGQTRAFVVWSRIITPTGVSIDVGSPATDRLGRGGLDGEVDTHFVRRFGSSILLTVIGAGGQALANSASSGNSTTLVLGGTGGQGSNPAAIALQKQIDMPDTIKVAQGVPVQVSVARDLDFSAVAR
ncbi:MAG: type IV secretion system protein VirB10 [Alphaproteobacteria bacterium]|nr:type IV secretion system protein VirB10 [Alphaproteobacteria bacterium]MBU1512937.1 type IV secretion system protein VirB10 [Alphaproteobacteria bacterium]MBU2094889.1 type IV secretion system protein VirB10 [Alphaproteobacteria bacterium]MBU2152795.1 type IV secretion system protein VirB10 [Alphaproteobacteria bacterium]MBU2306296.1 type IV secretion system protein VirB10 [Alphaproteobacteria bacterium]